MVLSNMFTVSFIELSFIAIAKENKEEGYLYYNPNSLPYNPTAPLRNTVPYIPIDITDDHIQLRS